MASQIQLAFYWISNCANCQSGNRASRLARWLAGWLAGYAAGYSTNPAAATRIHRACTPERAIALPRIDIFTPTRIIACTTLPSNTVEITDGFSNARAVGFTLLRKTRRSPVRLSSS